MGSELTVVEEVGIQVIDSLSANEFAVKVDGEDVSGIFRITGLVSFKLDVKSTSTLKTVQDPFKITKMVQRDPQVAFNRWIRDTVSAKADIVRPKRTLTINAIDDGVEIRRWIVSGAWISEVSYSEFNTGSGELIEETLMIQYDEISEEWPLLTS